MFDNTRLRSPSEGGSRKVYDYLNPDYNQITGSLSKDRFLSGCKPQLPHNLSPIEKEPTEYELIVEFELRREKEKNSILEERLRNKESFIKQMKEFQDELTITFEKCQEELHYYKSQCQEYESRWNSFATFNNGVMENSNSGGNNNNILLGGIDYCGDHITAVKRGNNSNNNKNIIDNNNNELSSPVIITEQLIREYVEEIAELKHLVIRLEEEINFYEKREKNYSKRNHYMSSSVKNEFFPIKGEEDEGEGEVLRDRNEDDDSGNNLKGNKRNKLKGKQNHNDSKIRKEYNPLKSDKRQQRSKTLANEFVEEKKEENFTTLNKISEFINTETRKISSFINHFLTMCEFFEQSIEEEKSIKHKLKKAWKWVKTAIAEWNYLKKEKLEKIKEYKIGNIVTKLLPLSSNLSIEEIEILLEKILSKPILQEYYSKSSSNNMY